MIDMQMEIIYAWNVKAKNIMMNKEIPSFKQPDDIKV